MYVNVHESECVYIHLCVCVCVYVCVCVSKQCRQSSSYPMEAATGLTNMAGSCIQCIIHIP